ncbi:hypothetical protein phiAS5_ORF0253 [Aeromonas phage phiAS5]|uniref:Uncharacterized protein n=1 Tax=Aeromonas phage phiAS5 TaxID=879630 RepID=E1A207_9CAUD|nr:hypothetical protein phiAS5_ORF0253 [Aeromonas phage phiAS5]ADM80096.1 hypothetical protein phiAS5_ORF0253 [Aeromonas phage phiAS5]
MSTTFSLLLTVLPETLVLETDIDYTSAPEDCKQYRKNPYDYNR